jgi:hypothetical protein
MANSSNSAVVCLVNLLFIAIKKGGNRGGSGHLVYNSTPVTQICCLVRRRNPWWIEAVLSSGISAPTDRDKAIANSDWRSAGKGAVMKLGEVS